jgi:TRAP-type mannitol/chloroaromatic compound transport system permease large subunit
VEGAATGGVVLFLYGVISGALSRDVLQQVLRETIAVTGALFALLVGATVFTLVLRLYGTDRWIADLLADANRSPAAVLAFVLVALALSALVLDAFEMIFVVIPVLAPPLLARVPDAPWVAVLLLMILQTSFLVPPLGYAVILVRNASGPSLSMRAFARALAPYVLVQVMTLGVVLAWPNLVWRSGRASAAAAQTSAPPALNDEQMRDLMRRELDEQDRARPN